MLLEFSIYGKILKSFFTPLKIRYCILNIFQVCLTVIPDFAFIYWRGWYTDVKLAKNNVRWHLSKTETSTSQLEIVLWLVQNKWPMHNIELLTIWVGLLSQ